MGTSSDEGLSVGGMVGIAVGGVVVGGIGVGICVFGYMQSKTKYWQNVENLTIPQIRRLGRNTTDHMVFQDLSQLIHCQAINHRGNGCKCVICWRKDSERAWAREGVDEVGGLQSANQ